MKVSRKESRSDLRQAASRLNSSSETQGFKGNGKGRERKGAGKKGDGRGGERKEERGSPGKLLYTDHFSIEEQTPLARCETEALV